MRILLLAIVLSWSAGSASGARNPIKPTEFAPLTSLPWKQESGTLEAVLDRIFLEPNANIRYAVLVAYLKEIPVQQLGDAFDRCLILEGSEEPDQLVSQFIPIWAERDPRGCWKRTKDLFQIVINEDWLTFDSWKKRPRIIPQNTNTLRASPFRLTNSALTGFPLGVEQSSLSARERLPLLREFAALWFQSFESWPGYTPFGRYVGFDEGNPSWDRMSYAFGMGLDQLRRIDPGAVSHNEAAYEIALRRWLEAEPAAAGEIVKKAHETKWPPRGGSMEPRSETPSNELLMVWAKVDLRGMIQWADPLDLHKSELARAVKSFLMCRVDEATRNRWFTEAKSENPDEDQSEYLWEGWMEWDPKAALDAAVATHSLVGIRQLSSAAYGPWSGQPYNTPHFGLGVINDFDISRIRGDMFGEVQGWYTIPELWGGIDIGETARYGYNFLRVTGYAPRQGLIRFFSGEDIYPDEGGMIDRTFCSLRVWAVVRPNEMKVWIATIDDPEMRKALTWLLDHPWGGDTKDKARQRK